jgi:hydrogenase maturation protease
MKKHGLTQIDAVKERSEAKIPGILGLGNLLLGDEGFGVHFVRRFREQVESFSGFELEDGGTAGIYMAPFLESHDPVIVVDAVISGNSPGTITLYDFQMINAVHSALRMSPHQLGLLEIMDICSLRGNAPELFLLGIEPMNLDTGMELSGILEEKLDAAVEGVVTILRDRCGLEVKMKQRD